jgi:ERCC4-related helicase
MFACFLACPQCKQLVTQFEQFAQLPLNRLVESGRFPMLKRDVAKVTHSQAIMASKFFAQGMGYGNGHGHGGGMAMRSLDRGTQMRLQGDLGLLMSLCHTRKLLLIHGLNSMRSNIVNMFNKPGGSRAKQAMVNSSHWKRFMKTLEDLCMKGDASANPKIGKLKEILVDHFARYQAGGTRTSVIVFTQFRDSVAEICRALETSTQLRVSPFVGQSSTKGAADRAKATKQSAAAAAAAASGGPRGSGANNNLNAAMDSAMHAMGLVEQPPGHETGLEDSVAMRGQKQKEQQRIVQAFRTGAWVSSMPACLPLCVRVCLCIYM